MHSEGICETLGGSVSEGDERPSPGVLGFLAWYRRNFMIMIVNKSSVSAT